MQDMWKGRWQELRGRLKQQWGELTDDELASAEGDRDVLVGVIQQRYGGTKEDIRRKVDDLLR